MSLFHDWSSFAARLTIGGRLPVAIEVLSGIEAGEVELVLRMSTVDRDTGEERQVVARESVFSAPSAEIVHAIVCKLYAHEAAEQTLVDGRRVLDPHPVASFAARPMYAIGGAPTPVPCAVRFHDTGPTGITSRTWDFGDGTVLEQDAEDIAASSSVEHTYAEAGEYIVKLTIATLSGRSSSSRAINVVACEFLFSTDGLDVSFVSYTSGSVASHHWAFGDGQTSTATAPDHTYAAPGTYSVVYTVVSIDGFLRDVVTKDVEVS